MVVGRVRRLSVSHGCMRTDHSATRTPEPCGGRDSPEAQRAENQAVGAQSPPLGCAGLLALVTDVGRDGTPFHRCCCDPPALGSAARALPRVLRPGIRPLVQDCTAGGHSGRRRGRSRRCAHIPQPRGHSDRRLCGGQPDHAWVGRVRRPRATGLRPSRPGAPDRVLSRRRHRWSSGRDAQRVGGARHLRPSAGVPTRVDGHTAASSRTRDGRGLVASTTVPSQPCARIVSGPHDRARGSCCDWPSGRPPGAWRWSEWS